VPLPNVRHGGAGSVVERYSPLKQVGLMPKGAFVGRPVLEPRDPTTDGGAMNTTGDAGRRWAARLCQLGAWSRELRDLATECDAALGQLPSPSSHAELVFTGTRDLLNFAAEQVDQTGEALSIIVELLDDLADSPSYERLTPPRPEPPEVELVDGAPRIGAHRATSCGDLAAVGDVTDASRLSANSEVTSVSTMSSGVSG
jgi:hypothetical protein